MYLIDLAVVWGDLTKNRRQKWGREAKPIDKGKDIPPECSVPENKMRQESLL